MIADSNLARKFALVAIAEACDANGVTWWGLHAIAEAAGISSSALRRHVNALERDGIIYRFRRDRRNGSRTTDLIVLAMERERPVCLRDYDGKHGGRIRGLVGKQQPPVTMVLDEPPTARSGESPTARSARTYRTIRTDLAHDSGRPPDQVVDQETTARAREAREASPAPRLVAAAGEQEVSEGTVILDRYVEVVAERRGGRRPKVTRKDAERAASLLSEHGRQEIGRRLYWALEDSWWRDKVDRAFARFAGGFGAIGEQMDSREDEEGPGPAPRTSRCYEHERVVAYSGSRCPECARKSVDLREAA
jgi:hypothetical protein